MPTASKKPTRAADEILPQLGNCDMIANHWAKELLTIFECTCVKEWRENQHLKVRIGLWKNGQQWRYSRHLKLASDKANREFPLIISSSEDILTDEDRILDPDTLIFITAH
jgi:hypothetical protein